MAQRVVDLSLLIEDNMPAHKLFQRPVTTTHLSHKSSKAFNLGVPGDPMTFQTNFIAQAAPVERSVHRGKSFDPVGKCETTARKGEIRVLQDREQIVQSRISSASASDEMTRRSRINAPIRAR